MTKTLRRRALAGVLLAGAILLSDVISPARVKAESTIHGLTTRSLRVSELVDESLEVMPVDFSEDVATTVGPSLTTSHAVSMPGVPKPATHLAAALPGQSTLTESAPTIAEKAMTMPAQSEPIEISSTIAVEETMAISVQSEPTGIVPIIAEETSLIPVQSEPIEIAQNTGDTFAPLTDEEIRQQLLIDPTAGIDFDAPRAVPSSTFLTPSAYGADWGDAFVGLAGSTEGNQTGLDGSASLGFGLGDAVDNVGVEVGVSIISLDGFADDGIVGFKVHKVFPQANNLAVAVGWSNPIKWGAAERAAETYYGVATYQFPLRPSSSNTMPLTVSLGAGTGTFRSTSSLANGDNSLNVFGSAGLRVLPEVSLISSWTGSGLGLAASAAPLDIPLVFTAGVSDVTDNTLDGPRFQGSMGYSFRF